MTRELDVLLIESHRGDGADDAAQLTAHGHRVHQCWSQALDAPLVERLLCRGVTQGQCPIDEGIDVALLVRDGLSNHPTVREAAVSCALRAGVPLVEHAAKTDTFDPFEEYLTAHVEDDVVAACEAAVIAGFGDLRDGIVNRTREVLAGAGIDPAYVDIQVSGSESRLQVRLIGPPVSTSVRNALGVRVLDAIRSGRRTFGVVDVSYEAVR